MRTLAPLPSAPPPRVPSHAKPTEPKEKASSSPYSRNHHHCFHCYYHYHHRHHHCYHCYYIYHHHPATTLLSWTFSLDVLGRGDSRAAVTSVLDARLGPDTSIAIDRPLPSSKPTPATSAPGLGASLPHLHRDSAPPCNDRPDGRNHSDGRLAAEPLADGMFGEGEEWEWEEEEGAPGWGHEADDRSGECADLARL